MAPTIAETMTTTQAPPGDPGHSKPHIPGEIGVWVFICGDLLVFSLLFCVFLYYRGHNVELFRESQRYLNEGLGTLNTVLMLTSSWFVASAVQEARRNGARTTSRLLLGALACGVGFGIVKVFEWGEKLRAGITLTTNEFFTYYYMLTGIHMFHVIIGIGVLVYIVPSTRQFARDDGAALRNLESGATYWHLVDLLWIVLFALLYLVK